MADRRYLKQRGARWYVQMKVPRTLQPKLGKSVLIRALGTSDLREAQRLRWGKLAEMEEILERARGGRGLSSVDIEKAAQISFRNRLEDAEKARQQGRQIADIEPEVVPETNEPVSTREVAGLTEMFSLLQEAGSNEDYGIVEEEAEEIIAQAGAVMPPGSDAHTELCRALLLARFEAIQAIIAHREGTIYRPPDQPFNVRVVDPVTLDVKPAARSLSRPKQANDAIRFSEAAERYAADRMRDPAVSWTEQTLHQYQGSYRLFCDFLGDPALDTVTREDAARFLSTIAELHKNYGRSPKARERSLSELLEKHTGPPGLSNKTLNRHVTALQGLYRWAIKQGLLPDDARNPFAEQRRPLARQSRTGWKPFAVDELNTLFHSPLLTETSTADRIRPPEHTPQTALMWLPVIALFSGMRSGEICQLRCEDVMEDQGVLFFNVAEAREEQRVKSEAGIRRVPVHTMLLECGFGEYLGYARGHTSGWLFPGLRPGGPDKKRNWYAARAFTAHRRRLGIDRPQVSFHSFRKNVGTALERARVPESEAVQVLGHEKLSMSYTVYSLGLDLPALSDVVERIAYPGVNLTHLRN